MNRKRTLKKVSDIEGGENEDHKDIMNRKQDDRRLENWKNHDFIVFDSPTPK